MYVPTCKCVYTCMCTHGGQKIPGAGITGDCEPPVTVGAGDQRSSQLSQPLNHLHILAKS